MVQEEMRPAFLEIDLVSEEGRALRRSVSEKFGPAITRAADLAERVFLLRSPWAPGLRFVGAETKLRATNEFRPLPLTFSLSGSGDTIEGAFVACMGEGVDRLSQIERPGDLAVVASFSDVADTIWAASVAAVQRALLEQELPDDTPLGWVKGKVLDSAYTFEAGHEVLLPADWCLRRTSGNFYLPPRTALSVGVAAGPNFDWAASRAVLELIERDAASLWWNGGRRGKTVPLDEPGMADLARLIFALRCENSERATWLLDLTTDIGVPVVAALSCNRDGSQLAYGLAARLLIAEAARAAVLELCQTELAILIAKIKRAEAGEQKLSLQERADLDRGEMINAHQCELLHPMGLQICPSTTAKPQLPVIMDAMARANIEVAFVDLSRPEFDIPVVRAVAPEMQPMPSHAVTERLKQAINNFGGGSRYTGSMSLII